MSKIEFPDTTLFADIETHSITERLKYSPREYFRLGGYSWGESDEVTITEDYDEMMAVIRSAKVVSFHNGHRFDLTVLFGYDSVEPLEMARKKKIFDTIDHAMLVMPAPYSFIPKGGTKHVLSNKPEKARRWFSLDNLAYQLGVDGKSHDLKAMAAEFEYELVEQPPRISAKTGKPLKPLKPKKVRRDICCGFGHIPLDHPEFREYLAQDVRAQREVARGLLQKGPLDWYAWRAQLDGAICAQIHRNGMRTDMKNIDDKIRAQDWMIAHTLNDLHDKFGFPVQGKKPLATLEGKAALEAALKDAGVMLDDLERTASGAYSFGGDSVKAAAAKSGSKKAIGLAEAVAQLAGARTLAQLAKASTYEDGKVHPEIMPLQKSGRKSVTNPGLTIWTARGPGAIEKEYFLPDSDDHVLVEADLSNADARGVAAMSGDKAYAVRFEPGQDGHMLNAIAAWGAEAVAKDPSGYRQKAKAPGHGWNYGGGAKTLAEQSGSDYEDMKVFVDGMNATYKGVVRWKKACVAFASQRGYIDNPWGRKMPVDPDRVYTQAPALRGQSWTTELINDALMKMPMWLLRCVKVTIHDAILFSLPKARLEEGLALIKKCMESVHHPEGGQEIEFPVTIGPPAANWFLASHEM